MSRGAGKGTFLSYIVIIRHNIHIERFLICKNKALG